MPEITPDLSDKSRCVSVHWSLPVQCVLPCAHRENWHEAWHPGGNRIRYRRTLGIYRTEELCGGAWTDLEIPPPGQICGEPYSATQGVFCQKPRTHNETTWTHRALFEGCTYTWNTLKPGPTPDQVANDLGRVREIAAAFQAENARLTDEVAKWRKATDDSGHAVAKINRERGAAQNRADAAEAKLHEVAKVKVWTNEDGKKFVFVDDLAVALGMGERR